MDRRQPSIESIRGDFEALEDWEDRYRYIIDLGRTLPPLVPALHTEETRVRGCASQVWLHTRQEASADGRMRLWFTGDSDALIVKGLVAIVLAIYNGSTPEEVLRIDARSIISGLGLAANLSQQRSNGLNSMIERIVAEARKVADDSQQRP
jgi:cysteine desulfuration protein SufE